MTPVRIAAAGGAHWPLGAPAANTPASRAGPAARRSPAPAPPELRGRPGSRKRSAPPAVYRPPASRALVLWGLGSAWRARARGGSARPSFVVRYDAANAAGLTFRMQRDSAGPLPHHDRTRGVPTEYRVRQTRVHGTGPTLNASAVPVGPPWTVGRRVVPDGRVLRTRVHRPLSMPAQSSTRCLLPFEGPPPVTNGTQRVGPVVPPTAQSLH